MSLPAWPDWSAEEWRAHVAALARKSFPGHHGRPGEVGGSLPREGGPGHAFVDALEALAAKHPKREKPKAGKFWAVLARAARKYNPNHAPAGTPEGGQFTSGEGGGGADQTKTAAFKKWFGRSKVVDKRGRPLVVYHATNADPTEFKPYTHFGTAEAANERASSLRDFSVDVVHRDSGVFQVMPVYLKMEHPLELPDLASLDSNTGEPFEEVWTAFHKLPKEEQQHRESTGEVPHARAWENDGDLSDTLYERGIVTRDEYFDQIQYSNEKAFKLLAEKGYDGIIYKNDVEDAGSKSYIIFDPRQVKSALGNRGTFNPHAADVSKYDPNEPREPAGQPGGGRWTHTSIARGAGLAAQEAAASFKAPKGTEYERPHPIQVRNAQEAVIRILRGQVVELPNRGVAGTVVTRLAEIAREAKDLGVEAPVYDLCQVSVAGENLFCTGQFTTKEYPQGIPRIEMPQLAGPPVPGSRADALPRAKLDPKNVDGAEAFVADMRKIGITTTEARIPIADLRVSQRELIGPKVAAMAANAKFDPTDYPIFVSRDNYIIDGHHRWATAAFRGLEQGTLDAMTIPVRRLDAPISEILFLARDWAAEFGIKQAAGVRRKGFTYCDACELSYVAKFNPYHEPAGSPEGGRFASGSGGGGAPSAATADQTKTAAFKRWFKDSKVIDEQGDPLVVYHATGADFSTFRPGESLGIHFGDREQANTVAGLTTAATGSVPPGEARNVMPVYLSLQHPLVMKFDAVFTDPETLSPILSTPDNPGGSKGSLNGSGAGLTRADAQRMMPFIERVREAGANARFDDDTAYIDARKAAMRELETILQEHGYDGIIYPNLYEGDQGAYYAGKGRLAYAVFSPMQIKSALGNRGTFDPKTADVTKFDPNEPRDDHGRWTTSYHLTDNPNFALDPKRHPENATTLGGDWPHPGLFVGPSPERWFNGYDYVRPFVAEIQHPDVSALGPHALAAGGYSGEQFIPAEAFDKVKVARVIPYDEWVRETFHEFGPIEEHHGTDARGEKLPPLERPEGAFSSRRDVRGLRGYRYAGPDVRAMSPSEQRKIIERADRYARAERPHIFADESVQKFDPDEPRDERGRWTQVAGREGAQTITEVGMTSGRPGYQDPKVIARDMVETVDALTRAGVPGVHAHLGDGGWRDDAGVVHAEPTWVLSFRGDAPEAIQAVARAAQRYDQESVLIRKRADFSEPQAQPSARYTFSRALSVPERTQLGKLMADAGFGGWTYDNRKAQLGTTFVPEWPTPVVKDKASFFRQLVIFETTLQNSGLPLRRSELLAVRTSVIQKGDYRHVASNRDAAAVIARKSRSLVDGPGPGRRGDRGAPGGLRADGGSAGRADRSGLCLEDALAVAKAGPPDEPRDDHGRWTAEGGDQPWTMTREAFDRTAREIGSNAKERWTRVIYADESSRLPNLREHFPRDRQTPLIANPPEMVKVYRIVPAGITVFRPGDWVALDRSYAASMPRGRGQRILSMKVPAADVVWAGTDENEFFYAPKNLAVPDAPTTYDGVVEVGRRHAQKAQKRTVFQLGDHDLVERLVRPLAHAVASAKSKADAAQQWRTALEAALPALEEVLADAVTRGLVHRNLPAIATRLRGLADVWLRAVGLDLVERVGPDDVTQLIAQLPDLWARAVQPIVRRLLSAGAVLAMASKAADFSAEQHPRYVDLGIQPPEGLSPGAFAPTTPGEAQTQVQQTAASTTREGRTRIGRAYAATQPGTASALRDKAQTIEDLAMGPGTENVAGMGALVRGLRNEAAVRDFMESGTVSSAEDGVDLALRAMRVAVGPTPTDETLTNAMTVARGAADKILAVSNVAGLESIAATLRTGPYENDAVAQILRSAIESRAATTRTQQAADSPDAQALRDGHYSPETQQAIDTFIANWPGRNPDALKPMFQQLATMLGGFGVAKVTVDATVEHPYVASREPAPSGDSITAAHVDEVIGRTEGEPENYTADSWEAMTGGMRDEARSQFVSNRNNRREFLEQEENDWQENYGEAEGLKKFMGKEDDVLEKVKETLTDAGLDPAWVDAHAADLSHGDWMTTNVDDMDENYSLRRFSVDLDEEFFKQAQWQPRENMNLEPHDVWPPYTTVPEGQGRLPGMPEMAAPWLDFQKSIESDLADAFKRAGSNESVEAPDYIAQDLSERIENYWDDALDDRARWRWVSDNMSEEDLTIEGDTGEPTEPEAGTYQLIPGGATHPALQLVIDENNTTTLQQVAGEVTPLRTWDGEVPSGRIIANRANEWLREAEARAREAAATETPTPESTPTPEPRPTTPERIQVYTYRADGSRFADFNFYARPGAEGDVQVDWGYAGIEQTGRGFGTKLAPIILGGLAQAGVSEIHYQAASGGMNGAYTWATFGGVYENAYERQHNEREMRAVADRYHLTAPHVEFERDVANWTVTPEEGKALIEDNWSDGVPAKYIENGRIKVGKAFLSGDLFGNASWNGKFDLRNLAKMLGGK